MLTYNTKRQNGKQLFPTYRQSLQMLSTTKLESINKHSIFVLLMLHICFTLKESINKHSFFVFQKYMVVFCNAYVLMSHIHVYNNINFVLSHKIVAFN